MSYDTAWRETLEDMKHNIENGNSVLYPDGNPEMVNKIQASLNLMRMTSYNLDTPTKSLDKCPLSQRYTRRFNYGQGHLAHVAQQIRNTPLILATTPVKSDYCGGCGTMKGMTDNFCMMCGVTL